METKDCKCFFITPIGEEGSPERKRADTVLAKLVMPVLREYGFLTQNIVRADREARAGRITERVEQHIREDHLCVIDLTGNNPNVLYEYGMRKGMKGSFVAIVEAGKIGELPFDVRDDYTMEYDFSEFDKEFITKEVFGELIESCIKRGLVSAIDPPPPISPTKVITLAIKNVKTKMMYADVCVYPDNILAQVIEHHGAKIGIDPRCRQCYFENERTGERTLDEQAQICTLELKDGDTLLILGKTKRQQPR